VYVRAQKNPLSAKTKAGAVALAVFIRRPQAEIKSAQQEQRLEEYPDTVNT
jgi:hypothetical protein